MNESLFRQIGSYTILEELGHGGMAQVFLATDAAGRTVALRRVPSSSGPEALDAERRGAELQRLFRRQCPMVPEVFDTFDANGAFHVIVEYIPGLDLAAIIAEGAVPPMRAVAIARELAVFLEQAGTFEAVLGGRKLGHLVHGDLTPRNVRLTGERVSVLDFGISKALSESRRATESPFESTPYVSPERLETNRMNPADDRWSVGVLLHEMLCGRRPFDAPTTREIERLIRARRAPQIDIGSVGLRAVAAKLLAPLPASRYADASSLRADLEAVLAERPTQAEQEGWPHGDTDATRRTRPSWEEATRPTPRETPALVPSVATGRPSRGLVRLAAGVMTAAVLIAALYGAARAGVNAVRTYQASQRLTAVVEGVDDLGALSRAWRQHDALSARSYAPFVLRTLESALVERTRALVERRIKSYGTGVSGIREAQWEEARGPLRRAHAVRPTNELRASLRFVEGHLHRIQGDANAFRARAFARVRPGESRKQQLSARQELADALTAFREAAELQPRWPDPLLGLARTFVYSLDDLENGEDAIRKAQQLGATAIGPEMQILADGYTNRGGALVAAAATLTGTPQAEPTLQRARDAFARALEIYDALPGNRPADGLRAAQRGLTRADERLRALTSASGDAVTTAAATSRAAEVQSAAAGDGTP
jgi:serine/threonine-protein kinase